MPLHRATINSEHRERGEMEEGRVVEESDDGEAKVVEGEGSAPFSSLRLSSDNREVSGERRWVIHVITAERTDSTGEEGDRGREERYSQRDVQCDARERHMGEVEEWEVMGDPFRETTYIHRTTVCVIRPT